jgi:hypothetical protein
MECSQFSVDGSYSQQPLPNSPTLANPLSETFNAETKIDIPFVCIWANIYGIGDFKSDNSTSNSNQVKCHLTA